MSLIRRGRFSRRAAILTILGTVFVLLGYSMFSINETLPRSVQLSYASATALFPLTTWGWFFLVSGVIGLAAAVTGFHVVGFAALMAMSSWWGLEFVASWISTGYDRAVLGALTWGLVTALLAVTSGWPDPPPRLKSFLPGWLGDEVGDP